jgi:hypothetical protein
VASDRYPDFDQAIPVSGLLGYLNFSDGRPDPRWQRQLDDAYAYLGQRGDPAPWQTLLDLLSESLRKLQAGGAAAFRDVRQAEAALARAVAVLPAYRRHHADLLAHLTDAELFNSFFLARVFEAVLAQGPRELTDEGAFVAAVLTRLNDFVGYRPVAVLETRPQGEPYEHERHRPVPLYPRGAGVAWGRYCEIVSRALELLRATDPAILAEAQFDPELLDELALDVRAYDHGHPANRRPNHVFGEWDPHHLDNQGRHRRYVARQITVDALLARVEEPGPLDREERMAEAAAVLACTVLMAAGVGGWGPGAHDSSATLATLLPRIARYRDAFYEQLLGRLGGAHAARLRQEQAVIRQPFGGARQHVNAYLARHRAAQLQQRCLAVLFAEMGHPDASREEAGRIPVVAVRLLSEVLGRLAGGRAAADHGDFRAAAQLLPEVEDLLRRGIDCGAFVDPWNVLGFQGLFPLSPAREDSVRDPRVDELIGVVEQTFNLYARLISEAAAAGDAALAGSLGDGLRRLAAWWDRFATVEVSEVRRAHGGEAASSAEHVARALARWRERGEAAADLAFWRGHLEGFRSPKAFALVVDALLRKADYRAALALLVSWLGQAEQVPLEDGIYSFHALALRWMLAVARTGPPPGGAEGARRPSSPASDPDFQLPPPGAVLSPAERRGLVVKFFDYVEANAEEFWQVPALEAGGAEAPEEEAEDLYSAAYDDVTYQDSTDDSEGEVDDDGPVEPIELEREAGRLEARLRFLSTVARLWQIAARFLARAPADGADDPAAAALAGWLAAAQGNRQRLLGLLDAVAALPVPEPTGAPDSLIEFDRRRALKEQLLHAAIGTCLDAALAANALEGAGAAAGPEEGPAGPAWGPAAVRLEKALFRGDAAEARAALGPFLEHFRHEPLLFAPLSEGGSPRAILRVRLAQTVLRALLANLPRLGLLRETYELLKTARAMEQAHAPPGRSVTEFNQFFQAAYQAVLESVIDSAAGWGEPHGGDAALVETLERLTAPFLALWVEHSRSLRLSVLETVPDEAEWQALLQFVRRYGGDLFHARFMTLANLRGILHRGAAAYLDYLGDNPDPLRPVRLVEDLGPAVSRDDAARRLGVVLEAVAEGYEEFKDYNTTTAQSDYGENLHVLLEFLRLKAGYERHAWQFRPLVLAHEVLARRGRGGAAVRWERQLAQLTREVARQHLDRLARLERERGVRLGTVADRLGERFVKPLALDRLCALIEPAMAEARGGGDRPAFRRLREELAAYTATPTGVGLDVPFWLRRLEMEVHRVHAARTAVAALAEDFFRVPRRPLAYDEVRRQLGDWERPALPG